MSAWRTDFPALREDQEALVAFLVGGDRCVALARRHDFAGERAWQSTFDGARLPDAWTPYAFTLVTPPDPALLEDDYG